MKLFEFFFPVKCLNCQAVSDTFEPFLNILLDIKVTVFTGQTDFSTILNLSHVSISSDFFFKETQTKNCRLNIVFFFPCRLLQMFQGLWNSLWDQKFWVDPMPTTVAGHYFSDENSKMRSWCLTVNVSMFLPNVLLTSAAKTWSRPQRDWPSTAAPTSSPLSWSALTSSLVERSPK